MGANTSELVNQDNDVASPPSPLSTNPMDEKIDKSAYRAPARGRAAPGMHIEIALEQKPLYTGYLLKRGFKNFASWKRRYVVLLENGYFNYYNSKRKIKGSVNFSNAHQCITCAKDSKKFYVLTAKRTWEFKAENKNETMEWVKLIQGIMNKSGSNQKKQADSTNLIKPTQHMYHRPAVEFDSDDDTQEDHKKQQQHRSHKSSSSYINKSRDRRRRSTAASHASFHSTKNNISFEAWKKSLYDSLRDIIVTTQHRQKRKNYNPSSYTDGYDIITQIVCDDVKLKTIFYRISNNKHYMTMKQYIACMSLIQRSRSNLASVATQLLDNDNENILPSLKNNQSIKTAAAAAPHTSKDWDAQSMVSALSTLSYFDDNQSMISELSTMTRRTRNRITPRVSSNYPNNRQTPRRMHSFKVSFTAENSLFSHIDGAFSILGRDDMMENGGLGDSDEELMFDELAFKEEEEEEAAADVNTPYDDNEIYVVDNEANIRVEIPVNPASEILGNFLGASCGLCVPSLDVISSVDSAETYKLLAEYTSNIDASGNAPTLLVYEELDGVSLSDLKKQLEVVQISIHYNENHTTNSSTTTQQRIQKYFVSVVRKTFFHSHYLFSHDGRSMIRDAGFVFAVDMFLFNIGRFPVLLPFEGKANGNNLFISTDTDGDSALYGLENRFMGGHDIIDMPYFLVNGGDVDNQSIDVLLGKQREYTQHYIVTLQKFLSVLSEYYQQVISPSTINCDDPNTLLHGYPRVQQRKTSKNKYAKLNHNAIIDKCLRPMANYLYIHCGFELIIIDTMNTMPSPPQDEEDALHILEIYRNKLIDNMITLLAEGILIGISEISDQMNTKDIDTIIHDIRTLDANMCGLQLIQAQFLKLVLRLFHSTSVSIQLNIEDSSGSEDEEEDDYNQHTQLQNEAITPTPIDHHHDVEHQYD
eukprot:154818_1